MTRPFEVRLPLEQFVLRKVRFAVELLDAITLSRVSEGVKVVAQGIQGGPVVNTGGLFVWLEEHVGDLQRLTVDPGMLPYEPVVLSPIELKTMSPANSSLTRKAARIELSPRVSYPFTFGITGLRATLIEQRVDPPQPVRNAALRLRWLDSDDVWQEAPTISHTDEKGGFAAILRLSPDQVPRLDASDEITVRLSASRDQGNPRESDDLKLVQGRMADPSTFEGGAKTLLFAWDELRP